MNVSVPGFETFVERWYTPRSFFGRGWYSTTPISAARVCRAARVPISGSFLKFDALSRKLSIHKKRLMKFHSKMRQVYGTGDRRYIKSLCRSGTVAIQHQSGVMFQYDSVTDTEESKWLPHIRQSDVSRHPSYCMRVIVHEFQIYVLKRCDYIFEACKSSPRDRCSIQKKTCTIVGLWLKIRLLSWPFQHD